MYKLNSISNIEHTIEKLKGTQTARILEQTLKEIESDPDFKEAMALLNDKATHMIFTRNPNINWAQAEMLKLDEAKTKEYEEWKKLIMNQWAIPEEMILTTTKPPEPIPLTAGKLLEAAKQLQAAEMTSKKTTVMGGGSPRGGVSFLENYGAELTPKLPQAVLKDHNKPLNRSQRRKKAKP